MLLAFIFFVVVCEIIMCLVRTALHGGLCDSSHMALTRVSRHVLIKKYLISHIALLICMIEVCTFSNKCFWILNLDYPWFRLVQIIARCRSAPSHYLNQCWNVVNWAPSNRLQWNFNRNSYIFISENQFENVVCKMATILAWPRFVNWM